MCENHLNNTSKAKIKEICDSYNNDPMELISVLHKTQEHFGYLPEEVQEEISINLNTPVSRVFGVVSFYSFFTMTPRGKYPISICTGTACYVCGAEKIVEEFERILDIKVGKTTEDGKFSLTTLRCVGACVLAPIVLIGEKVYGRIKVEDIKSIVESYK